MQSYDLRFNLRSSDLEIMKQAIGELSLYTSELQSRLGLIILCQTNLDQSFEPFSSSDEIEIKRSPKKLIKRVTFSNDSESSSDTYDPNLYSINGGYIPQKR